MLASSQKVALGSKFQVLSSQLQAPSSQVKYQVGRSKFQAQISVFRVPSYEGEVPEGSARPPASNTGKNLWQGPPRCPKMRSEEVLVGLSGQSRSLFSPSSGLLGGILGTSPGVIRCYAAEKGAQGALQGRPRAAQERPKSAQDRPRDPQEGPKRALG